VLTEPCGCCRRSLSIYGSLSLSPSLSVYLSLCMHTNARPHSHTLEILNKHEKLLLHKSIRHFSLRQKNTSHCHCHRQTHDKQQMPSWLAHKATNTNSILFLSLLLCLFFSLSLSPWSSLKSTAPDGKQPHIKRPISTYTDAHAYTYLTCDHHDSGYWGLHTNNAISTLMFSLLHYLQ